MLHYWLGTCFTQCGSTVRWLWGCMLGFESLTLFDANSHDVEFWGPLHIQAGNSDVEQWRKDIERPCWGWVDIFWMNIQKTDWRPYWWSPSPKPFLTWSNGMWECQEAFCINTWHVNTFQRLPTLHLRLKRNEECNFSSRGHHWATFWCYLLSEWVLNSGNIMKTCVGMPITCSQTFCRYCTSFYSKINQDPLSQNGLFEAIKEHVNVLSFEKWIKMADIIKSPPPKKPTYVYIARGAASTGCPPSGCNWIQGDPVLLSGRSIGIWVVVSNIFYFHPYLGKWSNLTSIFFRWVVQPPTGYRPRLLSSHPLLASGCFAFCTAHHEGSLANLSRSDCIGCSMLQFDDV